MNEEKKRKIVDIKEKIHEYTEYLNSELCSSCGLVALELEKQIKELSEILQNNDI